jgi:hypothetical protein
MDTEKVNFCDTKAAEGPIRQTREEGGVNESR